MVETNQNWWLQKRNNNEKFIPIQIDTHPITSSDAKSIAVYVQNKTESLQKYSHNILHYIGGQTHAICDVHNLPMIPVPDRIATCSRCERKEYLRCPELECTMCICRRCFDSLDNRIVNRIEVRDVHRFVFDA